MTVQLSVEVGDRVRFKQRGLPDLTVHKGWAERPATDEEANMRSIAPGTPIADGDSVEDSWQRHYGGLLGLVDCIDVPNRQARVRGKDRDGNEFAVWIDSAHLTVVQGALDFAGLEG